MLAASLRAWVAAARACAPTPGASAFTLARSLAPSGALRLASRLPSPRPPQPSLTPSLARRSAGADVIECRPDPPAAAAAAAGGEGGAKKAAKAKGGGAPAPAA